MNQQPENHDAMDRPQQLKIGKRGFSLPNKTSRLPIPPVKPPKKEAEESADDGNDAEKRRLSDEGEAKT